MRLQFHVIMALVVGVSSVSARELTLTLGGDTYVGLPRYEVLADGTMVGGGEVAEAAGQTVTVDIGDPQTLAVRFANDAAGPRGADGTRPPGTDRNLIIEKIEIDGTEVPLADVPAAPGVFLQADKLIVSMTQDVTVPLDGTSRVAEPVAEKPAPVAEAPAVEGPAPEEVAEVPPPACTASAVEITGYSNGVIDPPAEALKSLLAEPIPPECVITITGYSSSSGSVDLNLLMADQRASAVHDKLADAGVDPADVEVVAFGATTQFGPRQADNRRVVVSFSTRE